MLHRLNKLQFDALCATEAQAFEVRHNFSQICEGQIAGVIDKVCSRYVSEDEWIQIDRIEIDMGSFDIQAFEKIFTSTFLAKFEKEFSKKIGTIPIAEKGSSKQSSHLAMLFCFLQTGTLPWWAEDENIDIDAIFTEVAEQQQQPLVDFLEQHKFTAAVWQRMAMQFADEIHRLIISFFPELMVAEKKIMKWANFLAAQTNNTTYEIKFNQLPVKHSHKFILYHAPEFFTPEKKGTDMPQFIKQYANEFARLTNATLPAEEIADKIIAYEKAVPAEEMTDFKTEEKKAKGMETIPAAATETVLPEKFTVQYAGTVLLAPYFKQLFTHLNLLEQGEWKNREAHYKAIHLVRYLATGQQMCPEHTLVMEKLLCGMEINAPIPREVVLNEEEISEATALLKSVISNWPKLKNTSVNGLRETFLKRDGLLTKKDNDWLLKVERKTPDVLLEGIPWGYATLAFTWNNYIIFTEW